LEKEESFQPRVLLLVSLFLMLRFMYWYGNMRNINMLYDNCCIRYAIALDAFVLY